MCSIDSFSRLVIRDPAANKDLRTLGDENHVPAEPYVFSADGRRLACRLTSEAKRPLLETFAVAVYDTNNGTRLRQIPNNVYGQPVAFSPNGAILAVAGQQPGLALWDLKTGKELWRNSDPDMVCVALTFSPDGSQLAAGLSNSSIAVWDTARLIGQPVR